MPHQIKILLVGCGNMGAALLKNWAKKKTITNFVTEPNPELRKNAQKLNAKTFENPTQIPKNTTFNAIIFAVKPQIIHNVIPQYTHLISQQTAVISIAAGITIKSIEQHLPKKTPVIRTMPNTPVSVGEGTVVSCPNAHVSKKIKQTCNTLFKPTGLSLWINNENLIDAITAISGSGPAYLFLFIECLTQAAQKLNIPNDVAQKIARQTVTGAAKLAQNTNQPPNILRQNVTSKGGTTEAALNIFMKQEKLQKIINQATKAAYTRSKKLAQN